MTLTNNAEWAARTAKALLLIRILVGWVFVSEGIQKFLFPAQLGVGRFEKIGIPSPHFMAPFVGSGRDCLRDIAADRPVHAARGNSFAH